MPAWLVLRPIIFKGTKADRFVANHLNDKLQIQRSND